MGLFAVNCPNFGGLFLGNSILVSYKASMKSLSWSGFACEMSTLMRWPLWFEMEVFIAKILLFCYPAKSSYIDSLPCCRKLAKTRLIWAAPKVKAIWPEFNWQSCTRIKILPFSILLITWIRFMFSSFWKWICFTCVT